MKNTAAIILAAGKGTRLGQRLPKVLYPLAGKPMISYILRTLEKVKIEDVYVVTGFRQEDVKASIGRKAKIVYQQDQLGTAHAIKVALKVIPEDIKNIIVINGDDSAFYEQATIRNFISNHLKSGRQLSLMSTKVNNPEGFGRIVRDQGGNLKKIVEEKDATTKEKKIKEINIGCYMFNVNWVRRSLQKIKKSESGEYYITSVVEIALEEGKKVRVDALKNTSEWYGVNNIEQLSLANKKMINNISSQKTPLVFIIDNDNTILDTDKVKEIVEENLIQTLKNTYGINSSDKEIAKVFWHLYDEQKKENSWISIPELSEKIINTFDSNIPVEGIKNVFFTLPFHKYLRSGSINLLEFLSSRGEVVIFGDGDLVYLPIKIENEHIDKYIDETYVFEQKDENSIQVICDIYAQQQKIIIDDQIINLEKIKKIDPKTICIRLLSGSYSNQKPDDSKFKPDYTSDSLAKIKTYIESII